MQKDEWNEIQKKLAEKGPTTTRLPPYNVLKMAVEHVEASVRDLKRIIREWESGIHDNLPQPGDKTLSSKEFYHG
tara:strand:+ start:175 stop:399 length:225 start_codon:yes stop_codon:yes gene_type:complete